MTTPNTLFWHWARKLDIMGKKQDLATARLTEATTALQAVATRRPTTTTPRTLTTPLSKKAPDFVTAIQM